MKFFYIFLSILLVLTGHQAEAQNPDSMLNRLQQLPAGYITATDNKMKALNEQVTTYTQKTLQREQKIEMAVNARLYKVDSVASHNLFTNSVSDYQNLQNKIQAKVTSVFHGIPGGTYFSYLDTLKNSLNFLGKYSIYLNQVKNAQSRLGQSISDLNNLEYKLQTASNIEQYLQQREALLTQSLSKYGSLFNSKVAAISQNVYYYSAQIKQYKNSFQDPEKVESLAINLLRSSKAFNTFMAKNSMLAGFFNVPSGYGTQSVTGLQTLSMVQQQIQSKVQGGSSSAGQAMNQQIQSGMNQLQKLKGLFPNLTTTSQMPDFKPNNLKTKTIWSRFIYGTNIQFENGTNYLPTSANIAAQIGYQINSKSELGGGMAYIMGMAGNLHHISLSSQGISLRSFIDYQMKGTYFLQAGLERDYDAGFPSIHALYVNAGLWSTSALLGISKKYQISSKVKGTMTLLYDFLHAAHVPNTPPIVFRMGYEM